MVDSGAAIAQYFRISPLIIGLTVFALGTSLPELAASLSATLRGVSGISIGNVVGSNIFNILFILGVASLIRPLEINPAVLRFELPVLILISLLAYLFIRSKDILNRFESAILLLVYVGFIFLLFLR